MFCSCGDMCWILKGCHFHASSERTEEQCHWWSLRMDATRGASKNSLYQEIKWFSPLWKHWGCQQRKLTWNSGVPGTRRVSRLVWPWTSLSLSLGFSQASLQLTEPDAMGGFQLCPCPWWSQVTAAAGLQIRWLRPHSPSATGRFLVHESTTAGEQQPHVAQGSPGRLSELDLLRKSGPPSHRPLGTKLHGTAGVVSEDEVTIKESRRQTKGTGCWLFSLSHLPPAMPEVSPMPGLSVRSSCHL